MTDPTDPGATPDPAADETETGAVDEHDAEADAGNTEAARYRRRLREAETARAALADKLEAMQRAEVERLAGDKLSKPSDLWLVHPELAELLTEQGDLDPEKVTAALDAVVADRPSWAVRRAAVDFDGGVRGAPASPAASWADLLGGSRHRNA